MSWCRSLALGLLVVPVAGHAQSTAAAAGTDRLWVLRVAALTDENSYDNLLASFDFGVTASTWLSLSTGKSRAPSSEVDVEAALATIGIEHDFGPVGLGLRVEDWGDPDNLELQSWQADLIFGNDDYWLALSYESREIDIYFSGPGPGSDAPGATDLRRFPIEADGIGVSGGVQLSDEWRIYGAWMDYDYPRRIGIVPRADRLNLLSTSAVTLAYSFVDQYANVGFERAFGYRYFNVGLGRDRSAIDGDVLESISASMSWPVAVRLDLELMLGRSRSALFGSSTYGGLSFMVYGG